MLVKKKIKVSTFDMGVRFIVTDKFLDAIPVLKREGIDLSDGEEEVTWGQAGYHVVNNQARFYCVVQIEKSLIKTLKTLTHELFHLTQDILEYNGMHFKAEDANEIYARMYEFLFGEAYVITVNAWNKKYQIVKTTKDDNDTKQQGTTETNS